MWSHLLDRGSLEQLVDAETLDAQIRYLSGTPYKADIEEALIYGHTVASVDRALRANVGRTWLVVLKILPEQGVGLVKAVLANWDIFDLKTILRGAHTQLSQAEIIDSLMPAATLSAAELSELAAAGSVRSVVDTLATWRMPYSRPLDAALPEYHRNGELAPLELALDRWYYSSVAARLQHRHDAGKRLVASVVGTMVDIENLRTAFRLIGAELTTAAIAEYWLEGGAHISQPSFVSLCEAADIEGILNAMRRTPYAKTLEAAAVTYLQEGSLSVLERALENLTTREVLAARRLDPLGVGVVVAFLWAKQNEVSNIRIAVTGRSVGLPEERMRRELILV
jgi:V/A-type H+-transporting ATPase subunit C